MATVQYVESDLERIVEDCVTNMGFNYLKPMQKKAIVSFLQKKDVFVVVDRLVNRKESLLRLLPMVFDSLPGIKLYLTIRVKCS